MRVEILPSKQEMGRRAAADGGKAIREALGKRGSANIIVATGASQFEMLSDLAKSEDIDWSRVSVFHLDEYVGMSIDHPASFRKYLKERLADQLPTAVNAFHYIDAETDCEEECSRLGNLISTHPIDVAFIGIGENGHLAFNDPPADFDTTEPYLVVQLDEACRKQQLGEGWFPTLEDVPAQAISMSIRQILKSHKIVCTVPDSRKADAIKNAVEGPITNQAPASILQQHENTTLWLDEPAASQLTNR